ncbi:OsmC family protein [Uliginosibacterium paludis]|uniref:OsmC family protein n=1 Tax=Uliginosibacterium paludis TaxID=1615952 RepID=A0ABV2CQT1_9RHOO
MHEYCAEISWARGEADFLDNGYSRRHRIRFDGGVEIDGSSSPSIVPLPLSAEDAVDPEEAFVASLASCHMLWFLSIAAARGFRVEDYRDAAVGLLGRNARGRLAMTEVTLRPRVRFSGERLPDREAVLSMHHAAHEECFIASSVLTEVRCEPVFAD